MSKEGEGRVEASGHGAGQTLFEFVRHWSRRWNAPATTSAAENGRYVLVVEAVYSLSERRAATINGVAREVGIDQSGASRLVKEAVGAGYLTLSPSDGDARQKEVALTPTGYDLLHDAHRWQDEVFEHLTDGWTDQEHMDFHRAMLRILDRSHALRS